MFLEERFVRLLPGEVMRVRNILPKLVFVLEGRMKCRFDPGVLHELKPGSVLINFENRSHDYLGMEKGRGSRIRVLRLTLPWDFAVLSPQEDDPEPLGRFLGRNLPRRGVISPPLEKSWASTLQELRSSLRSPDSDRKHRVNALARLAALDLIHFQKLSRGEASGEAPGQLEERIERFLKENLHRQIRLEEVAASVDRTEEHIARIFRKSRGKTVFEELKRLRVDRARYLLLCTDLSVTRIAEQTGFASLAHFSRVFREATGKGPRNLRADGEG